MPFAALIPLAIAAFSAIKGGIDKRKAQKERERLANERPQIGNSEALDEQLALARSELSRGINTPGQVAAQQMADGQFSASLQALLQGGGNANNVADLYGDANTGRMQLAIASDNIRRQNIMNLMNAGNQSENFRQQQWQANVFAPWADNTQAAAASYQAANQQMMSGLANAGSIGANWLGSIENANAYNNYFGNIPRSQYSYQSVGSMPSLYSGSGMSSMAPTRLSGFDWNAINH